MGIKEGTYFEHWVLYASAESLYCTTKPSIILYDSWHNDKTLPKKKEQQLKIKINIYPQIEKGEFVNP